VPWSYTCSAPLQRVSRSLHTRLHIKACGAYHLAVRPNDLVATVQAAMLLGSQEPAIMQGTKGDKELTKAPWDARPLERPALCWS